MYFFSRHQYEEGVAGFERALALNPNSAEIVSEWGFMLSFMGRAEEGIEVAQKAMRLNPHYTDWYLWNLGVAFHNARRYEEAIAALMRMQSQNQDTRILLAASYAQAGREAEARAMTADILEENPDFSLQRKAEKTYYTTQAGRDHYLDGLRKAGLPE